MIDFVPFELAVKLNEKGYPQHICEHAYITRDDEENESYVLGDREYIPFIPDYLPTIASPTISQVLKWLRKEKAIHIDVVIYENGWYCDAWFYEYIEEEKEYYIKHAWQTIDYASYEQAAIAGIEYVIDNLI